MNLHSFKILFHTLFLLVSLYGHSLYSNEIEVPQELEQHWREQCQKDLVDDRMVNRPVVTRTGQGSENAGDRRLVQAFRRSSYRGVSQKEEIAKECSGQVGSTFCTEQKTKSFLSSCFEAKKEQFLLKEKAKHQIKKQLNK